MRNETGDKVYRKLLYYLENQCLVHFRLAAGGYKNGKVVDLNQNKLTLVLQEYSLELNNLVDKYIPFLCEEIEASSISPFRFKDGGEA